MGGLRDIHIVSRLLLGRKVRFTGIRLCWSKLGSLSLPLCWTRRWMRRRVASQRSFRNIEVIPVSFCVHIVTIAIKRSVGSVALFYLHLIVIVIVIVGVVATEHW